MKTTRSFLLRALVPVALLVLALLVTGCVGVVPVPASPTKVQHGQRFKLEDIAFVQPGLTTRSQVVARLGTNYATLPRQRAIAYSWELKGGGGIYWVALVTPYGGTAQAGEWLGGWRGLFVAFDDRGIVQAAQFKNLSTRRSLHVNLDRWVARLPVPSPPATEVARQ